jgi:hypothetical protein
MPCRAQRANKRRHDEQPRIARRRKRHSGKDHQTRAGDEHTPPTDSVRNLGHQKRECRITDKSKGQDKANLLVGHADHSQMKSENDRQESVGKKPDHP